MLNEKPTKFKRNYKNDDGTTEIWNYDLEKFPSGPIEVTIDYPKDYKSSVDELEESQKNLPITKQKFLNPANGKLVGYQRAKSLGII